MGHHLCRSQRLRKSRSLAHKIDDPIYFKICQLFPFYLSFCTGNNVFIDVCLLDLSSPLAISQHLLQPAFCFRSYRHPILRVHVRIFYLCIAYRNSHDRNGPKNLHIFVRVHSQPDDDGANFPFQCFFVPTISSFAALNILNIITRRICKYLV